MTTQTVILIVVVAALLYRRTTNLISFQPFRPWRMTARLVFVSLIALLRLALAWLHPWSLIGDFVGACLGGVLASYAIAHATFERRGEQWFFKTNPWIGGIVAGLLLVRLAIRGPMVFQAIDSNGTGLPQGGDIGTAALLFLFVGYNIGFSGWILWKFRADPPVAGATPIV